jgi:AraC-like DNA-binding protein
VGKRFSYATTREADVSFGVLFETVHPSSSFMDSHCHDVPYVSILLEGAYTEIRSGLPEARSVGTIVLHPAGEEHTDYFTHSGRCFNIALPGFDLRETAQRLSATRDTLGSSFSVLVFAFDRGGRAPDGFVESAAWQFVQQLLMPPANRLRPQWIDRSLQNFEWASATPLAEAAARVGVHYTHFSREFRRYLGFSPNEYRRRERIRRASTLLLSSSARLQAVALDCGFGDQSHFTNVFRELVGMTPAKYRRVFAA